MAEKFRIWIQMEAEDEDDADGKARGVDEPVCLGEYATEEEMREAFDYVMDTVFK